MRQVNRIPVIVEALKEDDNKRKLLKYMLSDIQTKLEESDIDRLIKVWNNEFKDVIKSFWLQHPDLRLTQVFVNMGIINNYPGMWYHKEDESLMIESDILEPRDILFWGQNYDKDMNLLSKTRWILIKDMNTDHIEAIIRDNDEGRMVTNPNYLRVFKEELQNRKN